MTHSLKFNSNLVLRSPLLPQKDSLSLEEIDSLLSRKEIREALFVASPSLYKNIDKYLDGEISSEKERKKFVLSVYKYLIRMMNRPTPFGLFSGCTIANWGEKEQLSVGDYTNISRHTRLDMFFLCKLARQLESIPAVRDHLKYHLNSSINRKNNSLSYVEYDYQKNHRQHSINKVVVDNYLELLLDVLQQEQALTINSMTQLIISFDKEIIEEEAKEFILELINSQIIISELEPNVTGEAFFTRIITVLDQINHSPQVDKILKELRSVESQLATIKESDYNDVKAYYKIVENIESIGADYDIKKLFQTDLYKKSEKPLSVPQTRQTELQDCFKFLNKFSHLTNNQDLNHFSAKFFERYEYEEVSLLDVLSTESGIGYPVQSSNVQADLIKGIPGVSSQNTGSSFQTLPFNYYLQTLFGILNAERNKGKSSIDLSKELDAFKDFKGLDQAFFSSSMYCVFSLIGDENSDANILLSGVGGSSGVNLLTRFAHSSPAIKDLIQDVTEREEACCDEDTIIAEVAHLPDDRVGNILLRPTSRKYEIPYLVHSTVDKENQISLSDIVIELEPYTRKIRLKSKTQNKYIKIQLSNAHNYNASRHPVYRFLCDMQNYQIKTGLYFSLGDLDKLYKFLPRITFKKVVLKSASWKLTRDDYSNILSGDKEKIEAWRKQFNIPQLVLLKERDNKLLIDFSNPLAIDVFIDLIKKKQSIELNEFIFDKNANLIKDNKGNSYTNELVAILHNEANKPVSPSPKQEVQPSKSAAVKRSFLVGSEWLYYKLYCGIESADLLITQIIQPIVEKHLRIGTIKKWFFIRYTDPDFHIRVRFLIQDYSGAGLLMQELSQRMEPYNEEGLLWKVQMDTYQRELKRYGKQTMELCEDIFFHDSANITSLINTMNHLGDEKFRWLYAAQSVDGYLTAFSCSIQEKLEFMKSFKNGYGVEFKMNNASARKKLNGRYREIRTALIDLFDGSHHYCNQINKILLHNNEKWLNTIEKVVEINDKKLLLSILHMHLNRLFRSKQRFQEFVLYYVLEKHYESQIARMKYKSQPSES